MKKLTNIIIAGLLVTVFILVAYIILKEPVKVVEPFDETPLRKEIAKKDSTARYWQDESAYQESRADHFELKVDSLEALKPKIHEDHDNQINFNATATDQQLDSVIRANWD